MLDEKINITQSSNVSVFNWQKKGIIFKPDNNITWMQSHACLPTPLQIQDSLYRIFFASRDINNRSHVGFFEVDLKYPAIIIRTSTKPVLAPGEMGAFDDHGVYAGCCIKVNSEYYMYTIGWNPGIRAPLFYASIGLAKSIDGENFTKVSRGPIVGRDSIDPLHVTGPYVRFENGIFRMWYVSGIKWFEKDGALKSTYDIKYAESANGVNFVKQEVVSIPLNGDLNIARPFIYKRDNLYHAWYAYGKGDGYKIGYATSKDGMQFERNDFQANIAHSNMEGEDQAIAHPVVLFHNNKAFMYYNGNEFGKAGIHLAISDL